MNSAAFVSWIRQNAARVREYRNGGSGTDGTCDCIGLIIGAWRMSGNKWPWTHGSNYTARYLVRGLAAGQPLRLGDLVFKAREPGAKGYALPSAYRGHHDKRDYYHVGVVTRTDPLEITHCTSVPGGIKRDTQRGQWTYSGQFNKLEIATEDTMSYQATVYAENGQPVKLRAEPSDKCSSYTNIKVGTKLVVWEDYQGRQIPLPAADALLYYNPNGGSNYHSTATCTGVKNQYLPLTAFTYGELDTGAYADLTPCPYCCPLARAAEIQEINRVHRETSPGEVMSYWPGK